MKKKKLAYISFHPMPWVKNPNFKLDTYYQSFDFLFLLKEHFEIRVYDRIGINYVFEKDDVVFNYDKTSSKSKLIIPSGLIAMIRAWNPDIVYLQGLGFPHYLIWLKYNLKPSTKFVVRDHADRLPKRCYKWLYKLANKHVNTYVFTSKEMANPWINNGFITSNKEIKSCVEGSTRFTYNEKIKKEKNSFLWVGRLDENKDPLTILKAFKEYALFENNAKLKLVFDDTTLLPQVEEFIRDNALQLHIDIVGKVNHDDIEIYYQKATFFILGSHKEGGPFSLIEAMACGCIPIVTNIPAFKAMTNNGDCGFLFSPGNFIELVSILKELNSVNLVELKNRVLRQFELYLSNKAISNMHLQIFSS